MAATHILGMQPCLCHLYTSVESTLTYLPSIKIDVSTMINQLKRNVLLITQQCSKQRGLN